MTTGSRLLLSAILLSTAATKIGPFRSLVHDAAAMTSADVRRAAELDANAPSPPYRIGMLTRDHLLGGSARSARPWLQRARDIHGLHPRYHLELARTDEMLGDHTLAESGFRKAVALHPRNAEYSWELGNFLLRRGRREDAAAALITASSDRRLAPAVAGVLVRSDAETAVLAAALPRGSRTRVAYLQQVLARSPSPTVHSWAFDEWVSTATRGDVPIAEHGAFLRSLLTTQFAGNARQAWIDLNHSIDRRDPAFAEGTNLVWNGSFDLPLAGAPLGWVFDSRTDAIHRRAAAGRAGSPAVEIRFRPGGQRSRRVLRQSLLLPPGRYRLSFQSRTEGEAQPVRLHARVLGSHVRVARTPPGAGGDDWSEVSREFSVSRFTAIRLRTEESPGRSGRGSVLIDDVRIEPLEPPGEQ